MLRQRGSGKRCAGAAQRGGDGDSSAGSDGDPDPDPDQNAPARHPPADDEGRRADEAPKPLEHALATLAAALAERFPDPAAREAAIRRLLDSIDPGGTR